MSLTADITVVLDRSGSMSCIRDDTIGGFNSFLKDQKATPGEDLLTLIQFDDKYETMHDAIPLSEVEPLTESTFVPRGSTALLDAIGRTINATGARLAKMDEKDRPEKVIFVIITDGHENASREFISRQKIFEMVTHQTEKYDWQFMYLGANQDAIDEGRKFGIARDSSMSYAATSGGSTKSWEAVSRSVRSRKSGMTVKDCSFTDKERDDSVEK